MEERSLDLDGFQRLLWNFASHRIVTVAGRTGVLRRLAEAPATTDEIATDLDLDVAATAKLIRALTALGVADAEGDRYGAAPGLRKHFEPGEFDWQVIPKNDSLCEPTAPSLRTAI